MNIYLKFLYKAIFLLACLLISCKKIQSLKLTLLNDGIKIYCPDDNCLDKDSVFLKQHLDSSNLKVKITLTNRMTKFLIFAHSTNIGIANRTLPLAKQVVF